MKKKYIAIIIMLAVVWLGAWVMYDKAEANEKDTKMYDMEMTIQYQAYAEAMTDFSAILEDLMENPELKQKNEFTVVLVGQLKELSDRSKALVVANAPKVRAEQDALARNIQDYTELFIKSYLEGYDNEFESVEQNKKTFDYLNKSSEKFKELKGQMTADWSDK